MELSKKTIVQSKTSIQH